MQAKERTVADRLQLAADAIGRQSFKSSQRAAVHGSVRELRTLHACSVIGYEEGAFAVVSHDDAQPAILAVSLNPTHGDNPGVEWWLQAMDQVLGSGSVVSRRAASYRAPGPDLKKYPASVDPLMTTHWGQGDPYYRLCPEHPDDIYCATGCVATAVGQVLNYHRLPIRGIGSRTIYYPYNDVATGVAVTANFNETFYQWDLMLDNYEEGKYTEEQALAVATLMVHCGVAVNMQYGGYNHGGSGTTSADAAEGVRNYFGFENARTLIRSDYSDEDWMDMVYGEISAGNPLVYGGQNRFGNGGHSFVLHGYDTDGRVYVNWGWLGDGDGYYNIDLLNPNAYEFSLRQDMIVGIVGNKVDLQSLELTLSESGTLRSLLAADADTTTGSLKVVGPINADDLQTIRSLCGRDVDDSPKVGHLAVLDLSEAILDDGVLPEKALYDCRTLTTLRLPRNIRTIGDGALGGCQVLQTLEWDVPTDAQYVRQGDDVLNIDGTELLCVVPTAMGTLEVPATVEKVHPLALAGCVGLSKVELPASLTELGAEALRNCMSLTEIRLHGKEQPVLGGYDVFAGVRTDVCKLYVRSGTRAQYINKVQWKDFGNNIIEYGTTIKARNASMDYGDAIPRLGYTTSGENVEGTPQLSTDATSQSLPGTYVISVAPGTITNPDVEYEPGTLTIYEALLTVKAVDCERRPGEDNPDFQLQYSGFVNGESESILLERPIVTTTATKDSPEGTYDLVVSGGTSDRYEFKYRKGTLTISASATSIHQVESNRGLQTVYTLDGRRVQQPKRKGVYVSKGKKLVITK